MTSAAAIAKADQALAAGATQDNLGSSFGRTFSTELNRSAAEANNARHCSVAHRLHIDRD